MEERSLCMREAVGSIPTTSTNCLLTAKSIILENADRRFHSSVGQSTRLLTGGSQVRNLLEPIL